MQTRMSDLFRFQSLYPSIKDAKMSIKTAYKFNKLMQVVDEELKFYQQKFGEIVSEYAKRDADGNYVYTEDGTSVEIADGRTVECQQKVFELQSIEVDLPDVSFTLEELEPFEFSMSDLTCLMPFIKD